MPTTQQQQTKKPVPPMTDEQRAAIEELLAHLARIEEQRAAALQAYTAYLRDFVAQKIASRMHADE